MLVGGVITTVLGLLLGAIALWQMFSARAKHALLVATPTTPIASTPTGQVVEIEGMAGPSEQGFVVSPLSGRQALAYRVLVWHMGGTPSVSYRAEDRREFWLRDQSGAYARILPEKASLELPELRYVLDRSNAGSTDAHVTYVPISPAQREWAIAVGGPSGSELMVEEALIAPGDRVLAQGLSERAPDGSLFLRHHPGQELMLSTLGERALIDARERDRQLGLVLFLFFSFVALVGIVLAGIGWYADL